MATYVKFFHLATSTFVISTTSASSDFIWSSSETTHCRFVAQLLFPWFLLRTWERDWCLLQQLHSDTRGNQPISEVSRQKESKLRSRLLLVSSNQGSYEAEWQHWPVVTMTHLGCCLSMYLLVREWESDSSSAREFNNFHMELGSQPDCSALSHPFYVICPSKACGWPLNTSLHSLLVKVVWTDFGGLAMRPSLMDLLYLVTTFL